MLQSSSFEPRSQNRMDPDPGPPAAKLQIAHINLTETLRGGPRQMISLVRELRYLPANDDIEQLLVVRRGTAVAAACEKIDDVTIRAVSNSVVSAAHAARRADIIHIHDAASIAAGALLSLRGTPFVVTRRLATPPKVKFITRWSYGRAARVVAISERVSAVMTAYLNGGDVDTIFDCVERAPGNVLDDSDQSRNFVVGCVGTIDFKTKGQDLLIDAARRLLGSCPQVDILFVGAGPDSERLRKLSDGLPNVRHIAWTNDIYAQFRKMDVLIQPSRVEGLGSTILEAMSMSLPVIATAVGGIPEIVKNNLNGLLVARDSPDDIAAAISRLVNDDSLSRRLGMSACRTARRLNAKTMAEEYYSTYLNVLARVQAKRLAI